MLGGACLEKGGLCPQAAWPAMSLTGSSLNEGHPTPFRTPSRGREGLLPPPLLPLAIVGSLGPPSPALQPIQTLLRTLAPFSASLVSNRCPPWPMRLFYSLHLGEDHVPGPCTTCMASRGLPPARSGPPHCQAIRVSWSGASGQLKITLSLPSNTTVCPGEGRAAARD